MDKLRVIIKDPFGNVIIDKTVDMRDRTDIDFDFRQLGWTGGYVIGEIHIDWDVE